MGRKSFAPVLAPAFKIMKIWLSKNSEIPVREQLITQITLGIASGELPVGARLPSTREIALRYKIHSNTVSHAYQILAEQGWLEFKRGSGFYVRETNHNNHEKSLDSLIAQFIRTARNQGFAVAEIKNRLTHFFDRQASKKLCIVENDAALREILIEEIGGAAAPHLEIVGADFEQFRNHLVDGGEAVFAAMFDEQEKIRAVLPPDKICVFLKANSAAAAMTGETRPTESDLTAVVSGWESFLVVAKIMLVAAQIDPETLLVRSTKDKNWRHGLVSVSMIICDSLTAKNFTEDSRVRVFRLVSDESLKELFQLVEAGRTL